MCSRTRKDLSLERLRMLSTVKYHTHSQWQSMTKEKLITSWWHPHTLAQLRNVCGSWMDLDFRWPLARASRGNCMLTRIYMCVSRSIKKRRRRSFVNDVCSFVRLFVCSLLAKWSIAVETAAEKAREEAPVLDKLQRL